MGNEKNVSRRKEFMRGLKFGLFSISAGIVEMVTFSILNEVTNWKYWPCYVIAVILSVIWNFTLNRRYTFQSANNVSIAMIKVLLFYVFFIPLSTIAGDFLTEQMLWNEYLVIVLIMLSNFVLEFIYDRFYVFGKSLDTNQLAEKKREKAMEAELFAEEEI